MMSNLNLDWKPEFGTIYTWFAMDKHGKIALFLNNCFGDIPRALLEINDIESLLDTVSDFIWEDLKEDVRYPEDKNGAMFLDYFSGWRFSKYTKDQFMSFLIEEYINRKKL